MEKGKQTLNWSSTSLDDGINVICSFSSGLCRGQCLISIPIYLCDPRTEICACISCTDLSDFCLFWFFFVKKGKNALTAFAVYYPPSHSDYGLQLLLTGEVCIIVSVHLLTVIIFSNLSFDVS